MTTTLRLAGYQVGGYLDTTGDVGGDYIDFLPLNPTRLGIVLGDASGKGQAGAQLVARTRAASHAEAAAQNAAADWVARVNTLVHRDSEPDQFVTLFHAILETGRRQIRFVNAGHPKAFLFGSSGIRNLAATGPPLGVFRHAHYDESAALSGPGDLLVIYSDGITEAHTRGGEFFGEAGICQLIDRLRDSPVRRIARELCDAARRFERGNPESDDDKAAVVVRITGARPARPGAA